MRTETLHAAVAVAGCLLVLCTLATAGDDVNEQPFLIDFETDADVEWYIVNDGVMGGLSQSAIRRTDAATGVFAGEISLENNGGFASVRARVGDRDLSGHAGLEIRVRGDGRTYQLRLRTSDRFDGIAYRAELATVADEWCVVRIPFEQFLPTFRGRALHDAPPLDTAHIHQVAFMLADKSPGVFSLEIDHVRAWDATPAKP